MQKKQTRTMKFEWIALLVGIICIGVVIFQIYFVKRPVCPPMDRTQGNCAADARKFCPEDVGYALESCLVVLYPKLTSGCQSDVDPCRGDVEKFCNIFPPSKKRYACLLEHFSEESLLCQKSLQHHEQCKAEFRGH